jgi:O-acetylserine/cysteine efflux transporter
VTLGAEALALASAIVGACAQIATKRSIKAIPPWLYLPIRWLTSVSALLFASITLGLWRDFQWGDGLIYALGGAILGPIISWNLYTRAVSRLDISVAYSITQLSILLTIGIAAIWLGERPGAATLAGAVVVLIGLWLVQGPIGQASGRTVSLLGVALAAGTAICWGLNGPLWKLSVASMSEVQVNLVRTGLASAVFGTSLGAMALMSTGARSTLRTVTVREVAGAACAGLLADVGAFWLQFSALKVGEVATVAPILGSSPLFVALLSAGLLGERLRRIQVVGVCLIALGVMLVGFSNRR